MMQDFLAQQSCAVPQDMQISRAVKLLEGTGTCGRPIISHMWELPKISCQDLFFAWIVTGIVFDLMGMGCLLRAKDLRLGPERV